MKKYIFLFIIIFVCLSLFGQRVTIELVGVDSAQKYVLPPKPDTCVYLTYYGEVLGYRTPVYKKPIISYTKEPKCIITLYNGKTFETENWHHNKTNKDASVFYMYGNKSVPEGDTVPLLIYDGNGKLLYKNENYGQNSFFFSDISDEGYFAAKYYSQVKKNENHLILFSPDGLIVFDLISDLYILGVSMSNDGQYIATIKSDTNRYIVNQNFYFYLYDNKGNEMYKTKLDYFEGFPKIYLFENKFISICGDGYFYLYNIDTKEELFRIYNYKYLSNLDKNSFLYFKNYEILVIGPHMIKYPKYEILIIDILNKEISTFQIIGDFKNVPIQKVDSNHFNINFKDKTQKYEISEK